MKPLPMASAWEQAAAWLAAVNVWVPSPTERHSEVLARLLAQPGIHGNLVSDAHLAALAIEHGLLMDGSRLRAICQSQMDQSACSRMMSRGVTLEMRVEALMWATALTCCS
jgi:hypothetical protein